MPDNTPAGGGESTVVDIDTEPRQRQRICRSLLHAIEAVTQLGAAMTPSAAAACRDLAQTYNFLKD